ncbi:hypothetical protein [Flexithrix dorotheae]|uniref:hypothetical protein n=1 Tax=Flexithrix dorotheae TaxID=70993 RepID=UPI00035EE55B|nr:hypothetical protein [Flexithrix dorotheae]
MKILIKFLLYFLGISLVGAVGLFIYGSITRQDPVMEMAIFIFAPFTFLFAAMHKIQKEREEEGQ